MIEKEDSFIREVNEELRYEKLRSAWGKYGFPLIGAIVVLILATGIYQFYSYRKAARFAESGDQLLTYILSNDATPASLDGLEKLMQDGAGNYGDLAAMRKADLLQAEGKLADSLALFKKIAISNAAPMLKDFAKIRAGYLLVDQANSYQEAAEFLEPLTSNSYIFYNQAREALAMAAIKAKKLDTATALLQDILESANTDIELQKRAEQLLNITHLLQANKS